MSYTSFDYRFHEALDRIAAAFEHIAAELKRHNDREEQASTCEAPIDGDNTSD